MGYHHIIPGIFFINYSAKTGRIEMIISQWLNIQFVLIVSNNLHA